MVHAFFYIVYTDRYITGLPVIVKQQIIV